MQDKELVKHSVRDAFILWKDQMEKVINRLTLLQNKLRTDADVTQDRAKLAGELVANIEDLRVVLHNAEIYGYPDFEKKLEKELNQYKKDHEESIEKNTYRENLMPQISSLFGQFYYGKKLP